jgi:hypothetical protein
MGARVAYLAACLAVFVWLSGCGGGGVPYERRAEWRDKAEAACIASGQVRVTPYMLAAAPVNGPSACSIRTPISVLALMDGQVAVSPPATINCPLTVSLNRWMQNTVQRAAYRYYGKPVVGIMQIASYGCRGRNGSHTGPLSEHAYGNAIDIAGFRFAGGEEVTVVKGWWRGTPRERAFLQDVFAGACAEFYTVLGPGSDRYHYNHFHVDLLLTNAARGRHYCSPRPGTGMPMAEAGGDPKTTASIAPIPFMGPAGD